jgi:hypothetical protein
MIYAYELHKTEGPYGTVLRHVSPSVEEGEQNITVLGTLDDTIYVHVPETVTLPDQPEEINFRAVVLTKEQKELLKKQALVSLKKSSVRKSIETDIGDVHDLIADCMKLIEFNMLLTARLAADYFQTEPMDVTTKQAYADRNQAFLNAVSIGDVTLRGSFEDADEMMLKIMSRYSKIQDHVKTEYIDQLKEIGLD